MYNLIITREPCRDDGSDKSPSSGEITVYNSNTESEVEKILAEVVSRHLYMVYNSKTVMYGDLSFILLHNGSMISEYNNTSDFDINDMTTYSPNQTTLVRDTYRRVYDRYIKNVQFVKRITTQERNTEIALRTLYTKSASEIAERKKLEELLKKYPDMVNQNGK